MREGTFNGKDGIELYYQVWEQAPSDRPAKAAIIVVHGFGENCNRWRNVLDYFPRCGYVAYVYDQRGFGRSPGQRGYINSWAEFREDLRSFVDVVAQDVPELKRFLYCHSMGGAVSLDYGLHYPQTISGVVASAPAIGEIGIHKLLFPAAWVLNYVYPRISMESPMEPGLVSRDPEWVKFMLDDPLSHGKGTARFLWELKKTGARVRNRAAEWKLPLFLMHGTADGMAKIDGSREFFRKLAFPDVEFKEYAGAYHEPHNDIIKEQVFADTERWLEAHC
jgi:alpha-beta hydrolase superfamily lysophospholipase